MTNHIANSSYSICRDICIGRGSFSKVYQGVSTQFPNKRVAIKEITLHDKTAVMHKQIVEEIEIMKIIKSNRHPNVVECYDIIHAFDRIYFVMEYLECGELKKQVSKPISEDTIKDYIAQIVSALLFLKQHNICHRDLKPANILITNNKKTVKLIDFGLAKICNTNDMMMNTMCGSPFYMSPELLNETHYDKSIDVWSIGMIIYELLYGKHPFNHCVDVEELRQCVNDDDVPLSKYNKNYIPISNNCLNLLLQMLDKQSTNRIQLDDILDHPWFTEKEIEINEFVLTEIDENKLSSNTTTQNIDIKQRSHQNKNSIDDIISKTAPTMFPIAIIDKLINFRKSISIYAK